MIKYNCNQEYIIGGMHMITRTFNSAEVYGTKRIVTDKTLNQLKKLNIECTVVGKVKMGMDEEDFIDNAAVISEEE